MSVPNFFIVGAPKCGTTALSEYLRTHPAVFMCEPKEPHYFATDFPVHRFATDWPAYLNLFAPATSRQWRMGEASVFYMLSDVAIPNIVGSISQAKFIVMLRNPIELAVSMHAQAVYSGYEPIADFEAAWNACGLRRKDQLLPPGRVDLKGILYDDVARTGSQLERMLGFVSPDRVGWWFLDDLRANARKVYLEVLNFLELEDDGRSTFDTVNPRKKHRVTVLAKLTQSPPSKLVRVGEAFKRVTGIREYGLLDRLRTLNLELINGRGLPPPLFARMREFFEPDVHLLSSIRGRSLDHWLQ